jgi:predicted transcriptional regulator
MTQLSIPFNERSVSRRSDPETSKAAASRAAVFATSHAGRILAALKQHGPMSPAQMYAHTGLSVVQCDRRRREMIEAGLVRIVTDEQGNHVTHEGCEVWQACDTKPINESGACRA